MAGSTSLDDLPQLDMDTSDEDRDLIDTIGTMFDNSHNDMMGPGGVPQYNPNILPKPMIPQNTAGGFTPEQQKAITAALGNQASATHIEEPGWLDKIQAEGKELLVIVVLFIIVSQPFVSKFIARNISVAVSHVNGVSKLNVFGLVVKGLLVAILYWIVKTFFL